MNTLLKRKTFFVFTLLILCKSWIIAAPDEKDSGTNPGLTLNGAYYDHNDSIHQLNFRYADRQRGIKSFITPAILITSGTALHFSDTKYQFNDWMQSNFPYSGNVDDYLRFAPLAAVYGLNVLGIKGKNNFGNVTAISLKAVLLNDMITYTLKKTVNEERPGGGEHSFPSGHTSLAFTLAQIMHHEFGDKSIWFSVGAYSCAATVGVMRLAKGAHWASDVLVGAGIGILSTELIYLTHQYKWDWKHVKNFDIFPWSAGPQKGLTLVYIF